MSQIPLFISSQDLKEMTILNGSVDPDLFMQYIEIAQEMHIRNYLGANLYNRLQQGILAIKLGDTPNELTTEERLLIDDYIQPSLIHFAAAEYLPFASYQIRNGGVFKHNADDAVVVPIDEIRSLARKETSFAEYYAKLMVKFLCDNNRDYPEYSESPNEISPDKRVDNTLGIYLGKSINSNYKKNSY